MKRTDLRLEYQKETGKEWCISAVPTGEYCNWVENRLIKLLHLPVVSNNEAFCEVAVGDTLMCMNCKHWKDQPKGCLGCRKLFSPTDC